MIAGQVAFGVDGNDNLLAPPGTLVHTSRPDRCTGSGSVQAAAR